MWTLLAWLVACGDTLSPLTYLDEANGKLAAGDLEGALASVEEGIRLQPDAAARWQLGVVRLEALARSGDEKGVIDELDELAEIDKEKARGKMYVTAAAQIRGTDDKLGALKVLSVGHKRFPGDYDLKTALTALAKQADETERPVLVELGYLEPALPPPELLGPEVVVDVTRVTNEGPRTATKVKVTREKSLVKVAFDDLHARCEPAPSFVSLVGPEVLELVLVKAEGKSRCEGNHHVECRLELPEGATATKLLVHEADGTVIGELPLPP